MKELTRSEIEYRLRSLEIIEERDKAEGVEDMSVSVLRVDFYELRWLLNVALEHVK